MWLWLIGYHASGDELRQVLPRKVAFSTRIADVAANVCDKLM